MRKLAYLFIIFNLQGCLDETTLVYDVPSLSLYSVEDCDYYTKDGDCLLYNKELFEVPSTTPLDVIFVLDVSQSMYPVLKRVGQGFNNLIESINNFDWQMAFTTSDHGDQFFYCEEDQVNAEGTDCLLGFEKEFPPLARWEDFTGDLPYFGRFMPLQYEDQILNQTFLTKTFHNPASIFQQTITHPDTADVESIICQYPPYCQGGNEQPLRVLKSIFSQAHSTHQDFFRKDVGLVVFVITNEPERVEDRKQATNIDDVINEFEKAFGRRNQQKKFIVYSISIKDEDCLVEQQKNELSAKVNYSENILDLVQKTDGKSEDLCMDDYASSFSEISRHIHGRIQKLSLNFIPILKEEEAINIDIVITTPDGTKNRILWNGDVSGKDIFFDREILPNSKIEVQYFYRKNSQVI